MLHQDIENWCLFFYFQPKTERPSAVIPVILCMVVLTVSQRMYSNIFLATENEIHKVLFGSADKIKLLYCSWDVAKCML